MKLFLIALLFLSLAIIAFQDLKYRKIHVLLPLMIFIVSLLLVQMPGLLLNVFYNNIFFLATVSIMVLYMSLKNKSFLNPFENYFGLGDLLFFMAITPLFLLREYIMFFIGSMLFSILLQLVLIKILKIETVPLAGYVSIFLLLIIIAEIIQLTPFTLIPKL